MTKVAVLDDWQDVAEQYADWSLLRKHAEVFFFPEPFGSEDEAAAALADFDVLLTVQDRTKLARSLIARLPRLRMVGITISNANLDTTACAERGIVVSRTDGPGENGGWAPAELALGLMISAFRGIPQADTSMRAGGFQHGLPIGQALAGRTLGVIGLGRLGVRLAAYGIALGMEVLAWNPNLDPAKAAAAGARRVDKQALLETADVVSIHVTLSDRSRGLIGAAELARMKPGALLINTSRGPIVDEAALVAALRENRIRAALDVFDDEPLPENHPLRSLSNTVLTPHLGFAVEEAWLTFYPQTVENVLAFLDGRPIRAARA